MSLFQYVLTKVGVVYLHRNFVSFKEWTNCVSKSYNSEFQIREIVRSVPEEVLPNLKNLKNMDDVWAVLLKIPGGVWPVLYI